MTDFITQNPVLTLLIAIVPVAATMWKVFHELYVKPRDFRIDSLRDELARLKSELDRTQRTPKDPDSPSANTVDAVRRADLPSSEPRALMKTPGQIAQSAPSPKSPENSLAEFYEKWNDHSLTKLQKQKFEKDWIGKEVRWIVTVESVSKASHGSIHVLVRDGNPERISAPRASLVFSERDEETLLGLKPGDRIAISGKIREFFLGPVLESPTTAKA